MKHCKDCIHEKVCLHRANIQTDTYAYMRIKYDTENCEHFKTAEDEVVRCKDCKYARGNLVPIGIIDCLMYRDMRKGEDFCNYGEKRDESEE
jgi:hypothetical protein